MDSQRFVRIVCFLSLSFASIMGVLHLYKSGVNRTYAPYSDFTPWEGDTLVSESKEPIDFDFVSDSYFLVRCDGSLLGDPEHFDVPLLGTNFDYQQAGSCSEVTFVVGFPTIRATEPVHAQMANPYYLALLCLVLAIGLTGFWWKLCFR